MKKYNDFSDNHKMTKYFRKQISWADPKNLKSKTLPGDTMIANSHNYVEHKLYKLENYLEFYFYKLFYFEPNRCGNSFFIK